MIHNACWNALATRCFRDKAALNRTFVGFPRHQIAVRQAIENIQREWFFFVHETSFQGEVSYLLTPKAIEKEHRVNERRLREEAGAGRRADLEAERQRDAEFEEAERLAKMTDSERRAHQRSKEKAEKERLDRMRRRAKQDWLER